MFRKIKLFCQSEEESKSPDFLIDCLNVACKHLDKKAGGVDTEDWQSLPILPSRFEIMGELLSKHKSLSKVSVDRGYKDGDDYMSTYFRLLRAEAFTGIQTGIQDFLRDPTAFEEDKVFVYENVGLVGLEVSHKSVCLALKFTTPKPADNWAMSRRLMQGNLVCISVDTGFFSYFWATVSNRDVDVLRDKSTIFVEVCRNERWQNLNLPNLEVGECTAVMLESPTYFLPMQAVLSRFSEKSIRKFKLYSEIVKAKPSHSQLTYLTNQSETIRKWLGASEKQDEKDTSVGRRSKERDVLFGWMYRGKRIANVDDLIEKHMKCFDPSQKEAYKYALTHKLAIVQGPPGCGKTFIGHKILEVILACRPDTPVLILTYKNHALDEFLKGALGFCHDRLVRVGNRSDEPELDEYNLNKRKMGKHFFDENGIGSRRNDINAMGLSAWQSMQAVYDASHLKDHSWLLSLTETQIEQLIIRGNPELDMRANLRDMKKHGSLRNFAEWCLRLNWQYKNGDKPAKCFLVCLDALHTAVIKWFPFKSEGQAAEGRLWPRRMAKQNSQPGTEDFDEEDFEEMQKARDIGGDGLHRDPRYMLSDHGSPIFTLNQIPGESTANDASLLDRNDLWDLSTQEREEFIATILSGRHQQARTQFHDIYNSLGRSVRIKSHLGREGKLSGLGDELVIGMTITGASINYDVIEQVRPSVVIVEEAAEVLEPSLLAALSRSTQHLIMIGDHKQLRPGVETHELVRNHSLDVSMMERLIKSGYPFRSLKTQSRMRPEFSALLKDIYPDLRDNLEVVCKRKPLACMAKSLFFWTHSHEEDRCFRGDTNNASKTNTAEADMVTALAIFIVQSGCPTEELTILASYQGQARLIRKKIRATAIAPVAPEIIPLRPPKTDVIRPTIKAAYKPTNGSSFATNAKAMASGTRASATVKPERISARGLVVR